MALVPGSGHISDTPMNLILVLWVGAGSALGGMSRYALTHLIQSRLTTPFPVATLGINVVGSLVLAFVVRLATESAGMNPEVQVFLTSGFCGGFTTFSTFSYETARLLETGDYMRASLYVAASVLLSLAAAFAGFALARSYLAARQGM
jgi:fluoride exporter